ncbi:MAG: GerMN domain-containing protein [Acetivibrionales bacterium]
MKKCVLLLLIAAALVVGMAACANKEVTSKQQDEATAAGTTVNTDNENSKIDIQEKEPIYKARLYFSDIDAINILLEEREVKVSESNLDNEKKAELIVKELLQGPQSKEASASIPKGTKLNSVTQENETLIIDLSKEFIENSIGGSAGERMAFAPIVLSLTELEGINQVSFKIDGIVVKEYGGNYTLDQPFNRDEFMDLLP